MGNFVVNIVPRTNDLFGNAANTIYTLLENNVCRGQVDVSYVTAGLRLRSSPVTHVAVLFQANEPKGFMTMVRNESKLFIDVICSEPGFGKPMIVSVLSWADTARIRDVELHALPGVLFYYQQYGFDFRKSCSDKPVVFTPEQRAEYLSQKIQFYNEAENNPIAIQYLKLLQERSLNLKRYDRKGHAICGPEASLEEISNKQCAEDGYMMHRC
jgi:hypothetical protein